MNPFPTYSLTRNQLQKLVGISLIGIWIFRFYSYCMLHQLQSPVLKLLEADNTYWLLHYFSIPQMLITHSTVTTIFDGTLLLLPIGMIIYPSNKLFPVITWIFWGIYFITFGSYFNHHGHSLIGVFFILPPFFIKKSLFHLSWQGVRYYTCFIYLSAAIWKIARGTAFELTHIQEVLISQNASQLLLIPDALISQLTTIVINYPDLAFIISMAVAISQLSFGIGFFTRKYDFYLIILGLLFHTATYLFMDILFFELCILYLAFLIPKTDS